MMQEKKRMKHRTPGAIIWIIVKYLSLVFFAFVAVLPVVSCVITAFKTDAEYQSTNVMTLPQSWFNLCGCVQESEYGIGISQFSDRYDLCVDDLRNHWNPAGIRVKPF